MGLGCWLLALGKTKGQQAALTLPNSHDPFSIQHSAFNIPKGIIALFTEVAGCEGTL